MQATIRQYTGSELADLLEARHDDVEALISGVNGLQGYFLIRTADGCASITVCDDAAGIEESEQRAHQWIAENASGAARATPEVTSGEVVIQIGAPART